MSHMARILHFSEAPEEYGSSCSEDYDFFIDDGSIDDSVCSDRELQDAEGFEEQFDMPLTTDSGEGTTAHCESSELVTRRCQLSPLASTPSSTIIGPHFILFEVSAGVLRRFRHR